MHDLEFLFYLVDCDDCPSPLNSTRFGSAKYEEKKKTKKGHGGNSRDARFRFWVYLGSVIFRCDSPMTWPQFKVDLSGLSDPCSTIKCA